MTQTKVENKTEREITMEDVIISNLIPNLDPMNLKYLGKGWFKDSLTGTTYQMSMKEGVLFVLSTRQSKAITKESRKTEKKPKQHTVPKIVLVDIKCLDCGAIRTIHKQDAFQVKRCVECQKKHRNTQRSESIKAKRAEKKV